MKKILALLLTVVMVLSVTACSSGNANGGSDTTDNKGSNTQGGSSVTDGASKDDAVRSSFTLNGVTFNILGDFKEKSAIENAVAINNGSFTVSVNYGGEPSYENQEKEVKSRAGLIEKSNPDSTVEVLKNEKNGIFYYTEKNSEYSLATCVYITGGVVVSFKTTNFSAEAIEAITSITFGK